MGHKYKFMGSSQQPTGLREVLLMYCKPFVSLSVGTEPGGTGFWTKHGLDLTTSHTDPWYVRLFNN